MELRTNPRNPYKKANIRTDDYDHAVSEALDAYGKIYKRINDKKPLEAFSFAAAGAIWLTDLKQRTETVDKFGKPLFSKKSYNNNEGNLDRYLIPFFDEQGIAVDEVSQDDIDEFILWRRDYYVTGPGKDEDFIEFVKNGILCKRPAKKTLVPAKGTLEKTAITFRKLLRFHRVHSKFEWDWNPLDAQEAEHGQGAFFSEDELTEVKRTLLLRTRVPKGEKLKEIEKHKRSATNHVSFQRRLMRYFCLFMLHTGVRPQEAQWLKFEHLKKDISVQDADYPYLIDIFRTNQGLKHRTHTREIQPIEGLHEIMSGLVNLYVGWDKPDAFDGKGGVLTKKMPGYLNEGVELKNASWLWMNPDGSRLQSFDKQFHSFLEDYDLLKDQEGRNRNIYSLRHFYATDRIYNSVELAFLAKNMGTTEKMLHQHYDHAVVKANKVQRHKLSKKIVDVSELIGLSKK